MTTDTKIYPLPQIVLEQLSKMYYARQTLKAAGSTSFNWVEAYQLVYDTVKNDQTVDQGTKNWLDVAIRVNSHDSKDLVYNYVSTETLNSVNTAREKNGLPPMTEEDFRVRSDLLGDLIIGRVLGLTADAHGVVSTIASGPENGIAVATTLAGSGSRLKFKSLT